MAWECAECSSRETDDGDVNINAVCHHCGKPLCRRDRVEFIDSAFSLEYGVTGRAAFHCRRCRRRHHRSLAALMERDEE